MKTFKSMIPDLKLPEVRATSEDEARREIIKNLKERLLKMTDSEIESEFGLVIWENE